MDFLYQYRGLWGQDWGLWGQDRGLWGQDRGLWGHDLGLWGHNLVKIEAKIEVFGVKIGASLATIGILGP